MKKCPYCAEEIQDEAIKCKHCGEWFGQAQLGQSPPALPQLPSRKTTDVVPLNRPKDKKCPKCKLINSASAIRCDCGFEFSADGGNDSHPAKGKGTKQRSGFKTLVSMVVTLILMSIVGALGRECGDKLFKSTSHIISPEKPYTDSTASWRRRYLPGTGLSADLPGEMAAKEISLPPQIKDKISTYKSYEYATPDFGIFINYVLYVDGMVVSPEKAARGGVENLKLENLKYSIMPQEADKVLLNGTFNQSGQICFVNGIVIGFGRQAWTILVMGDSSDAYSVNAAKRVLESVQTVLDE